MHRDAEGSRLLEILSIYRPVFSAPCFDRFVLVALGWLLTPHAHAITAALVVTGVSGQLHHAAFHRLFSRASWNADLLGFYLLEAAKPLLPPESEPLRVVLDDTLSKHKGPQIWGLGRHLDAVRSSSVYKVFAFGHVWVVLAVVVQLPCTHRPFALPVLLRLYRHRKTCLADERFLKKTELARELLLVLSRWQPGRRLEVRLDEGYANRTVLWKLPDHITVVGALRADVALFDPIVGTGARKYGDRQPSAKARLDDPQTAWTTATLTLGAGPARTVRFTSWLALARRCTGWQRLRIVMVDTRAAGGRIRFRLFFSTDPSLSPTEVLLRYAERWSIEVTFFEMKQFLGFEDSSARHPLAVRRMVPFVAALYGAVVLWYARHGADSRFALQPVRPWYRRKQGPSFADMLGAAQRATWASGRFDPLANTNNLLNPAPLLRQTAQPREAPPTPLSRDQPVDCAA